MGNFVVVGQIRGTVDFGGGAIVADASDSIFLAKFSGTDGSHIWSKKMAPYSVSSSTIGIAMDTAGNVGLVGAFTNTFNVGGGTLTSNGDVDCWVARFNSMGQHVWSKRFGDTGTDIGYAIDVDDAGNLLVTGSYSGAVDFGNGPVTNGGGLDVFLIKLAGSNGALQWANHFGLSSSEEGQSVSVAPDGTISVTGNFSYMTDFGTGTINVMNFATEVFVVKYNALGALLWGQGVGATYANTIRTDKDNNSGITAENGSSSQTWVQKFLP